MTFFSPWDGTGGDRLLKVVTPIRFFHVSFSSSPFSRADVRRGVQLPLIFSLSRSLRNLQARKKRWNDFFFLGFFVPRPLPYRDFLRLPFPWHRLDETSGLDNLFLPPSPAVLLFPRLGRFVDIVLILFLLSIFMPWG